MQRIALALLAIAVTAAPAAAKPRPDLTVRELQAPAQVDETQKFDVELRVRNVGRRTARRSQLGLFLSRDRVRDFNDLGLGLRHVLRLRRARSERLTTSIRIPEFMPWGYYWLLACADAKLLLAERSERNNCQARPLAVTGGPGRGPVAVSVGSRSNINAAIATAVAHGLHEVDLQPGVFAAQTVVLADGVNVVGAGATIVGRQFDTGGGAMAGVALVADHLTQPTRVEGLTIQAPDLPTRDGRDSIGILARDDAPGSLVLSHVTVRGGTAGAPGRVLDGQFGIEGGYGAAGGDAQELAASCDDAPGGAGGAAGTPGSGAPADVAGGAGGDGGAADTDCSAMAFAAGQGWDGEPAALSLPPWVGVGGNGASPCGVPVDGGYGLDGDDGDPPATPATGGGIAGSLWTATSGLRGGDGTDGSGGGGGGGSGGCDGTTSSFGAGGGGGGAGGTGGGGGGGGRGGGGSFGLVVVGGSVRVEASAIAGGMATAGGAGGRGGRGGFGGGGAPGGGGVTGGSRAGGNGGSGGDGGAGADGGGGAGGASAGVLLAGGGALDADVTSQFTAGTAGAGGKGAVDGAAGAALAVLTP